MTYKRRLFVSYYLGECQGNGTEAAKKAGFASPKAESHRLLSDVDVRALIDAHADEAGMAADEIMARLTDQASSDVCDLLGCTVEDVVEIGGEKIVRQRIDPEEVRRRGLGHLIKKITPNKYGYTIELHDAQRALEILAKIRGLLKEQIRFSGEEIDYSKLSDDELQALARGRKPPRW